MDETNTLLHDLSSEEEKLQAANNIITMHEICLESKQILNAYKIVRQFLLKIDRSISPYESIDSYLIDRKYYYNYPSDKKQYDYDYHKDPVFVLNKLLRINKQMYTAVILALNDKMHPLDLSAFVEFEINKEKRIISGSCTVYYQILLNYCEFDVSTMDFDAKDEKRIQDYCTNKYGGKKTKPAIKREFITKN